MSEESKLHRDEGPGSPTSVREDKPTILVLLDVVSKSLAALSILIAASFYISDRLLPIKLKTDPPVVVELRCSSRSFKPEDCLRSEKRDLRHVSLSAALRFTASGPSAQTITIENATANLKYSNALDATSDQLKNLELTAFWTGDLTGGRGNFQQVVAQSIVGGQTISREIWFMPLAKSPSCVPRGQLDCSPERDNFRPWHRFLGDIQKIYEAGAEADIVPEVLIDFTVWWRPNNRTAQPQSFTCRLEIGESARAQIAGFNEVGAEHLYLTLPCQVTT